ncbi:MAG: hypothetical protein RQ753_10395 [Desulfurivibrionaceae bacterium]|nr:hypothetical protein [Desulfobulbales bacterium]MDT8336096.1 hypothetical protein [Desulfurivibrionaceae bacterium]
MSDEFSGGSGTEGERPWLDRESRFSKSEDQAFIARSMQYVKDHHGILTLVSDCGGVYQESLLINIEHGALLIDKPLEWAGEPDSFRIFFRDRRRIWNYFPVSGVSYSPFALTVAMPEELHCQQRRACPRVMVPPGTRALVKNGSQAMATVFVHDLSAAGMLMCNDPAEGEYATDSIINDIVVSLPAGGTAHGEGNVRKVLPLIGQGRIVRSYLDKETQRPCYGVSFQYESVYVKETINQIVSEVASDDGRNDFL